MPRRSGPTSPPAASWCPSRSTSTAPSSTAITGTPSPASSGSTRGASSAPASPNRTSANTSSRSTSCVASLDPSPGPTLRRFAAERRGGPRPGTAQRPDFCHRGRSGRRAGRALPDGQAPPDARRCARGPARAGRRRRCRRHAGAAGRQRGAIRSVAAETGPARLPDGQFDVILADPPWLFDKGTLASRDFARHYPNMPLEDIADYRDADGRGVPDVVADRACSSCGCPLSSSRPCRPFSLPGDSGTANWAWSKDKTGASATGHANQRELIDRGGPWRHARSREIGAALMVSSTPLEAPIAPSPSRCRSVEVMYPDARRLELFARQARPGWAVLGNQLEESEHERRAPHRHGGQVRARRRGHATRGRGRSAAARLHALLQRLRDRRARGRAALRRRGLGGRRARRRA